MYGIQQVKIVLIGGHAADLRVDAADHGLKLQAADSLQLIQFGLRFRAHQVCVSRSVVRLSAIEIRKHLLPRIPLCDGISETSSDSTCVARLHQIFFVLHTATITEINETRNRHHHQWNQDGDENHDVRWQFKVR